MLFVDQKGIRPLFNILKRIREGRQVSEAELDSVLDANAFFVDFYSGWDGSSREIIRETIRKFDQPEQLPPGKIPGWMAEGFRLALDDKDTIDRRLAWLATIDVSGLGGRILSYLPPGTVLDSVIHITIDQINNAFVFRREMGVSVLKGMHDLRTFEEAVSHELHHVCYRFWAEQDAIRQKLAQEHTGHGVAVLHVDNLLSEGMANFYCTPGYVFRDAPDTPPPDPYQARLARFQREERQFFQKAEDILALCLRPGVEYDRCWEAIQTIAFDLEDGILPAGHYLGARMIQTLEKVDPREQIIRLVKRLPDFLRLYNQAAQPSGEFVFDQSLVEDFARLWE